MLRKIQLNSGAGVSREVASVRATATLNKPLIKPLTLCRAKWADDDEWGSRGAKAKKGKSKKDSFDDDFEEDEEEKGYGKGKGKDKGRNKRRESNDDEAEGDDGAISVAPVVAAVEVEEERPVFTTGDELDSTARRGYQEEDPWAGGEDAPPQRRQWMENGDGGDRRSFGAGGRGPRQYNQGGERRQFNNYRRPGDGGEGGEGGGERKQYNQSGERRQYNQGGERRQYNQGAGEGGGERRQYNQGAGEGSGERRQYNQGAGEGGEGGGERRQYGGGERRQYNPQEGGEGGERQPLPQYNNFRRPGASGEQQGGAGRQQGGGERRTWNGPRAELSEEARAQRQQVNDAIYAANTWRELAGVLEAQGPRLDGENITAILRKIARDNDNRPKDAEVEAKAQHDQLLSNMLGWVITLLPTFRPKHVAGCMHSLAKLSLFNPEVVAGLINLGATFMGNFSPVEYSNMVWALAKLNYPPPAEWAQALIYRSQGKMRDFGALEMANLVASLGKLSIMPPAEWMAAMCEVSGSKAKDFNNIEFVNMVMGVATLAKDHGYQPSQVWVDAMFSLNLDRAMQLRVGELSRTLWALSNFAAKPAPAYFNKVYDSLHNQMKYATEKDLGSIALYIARYLQAPAPERVCERVATRVEGMWRGGVSGDTISGDDLAAVAYMLAISGYKPKERYTDDLVIAVKERLPTCTTSGLEMVYTALPMLGTGFRLNEVVTDAANRYNDLIAAQQQQVADAAASENTAAAAAPEQVAEAVGA